MKVEILETQEQRRTTLNKLFKFSFDLSQSLVISNSIHGCSFLFNSEDRWYYEAISLGSLKTENHIHRKHDAHSLVAMHMYYDELKLKQCE